MNGPEEPRFGPLAGTRIIDLTTALAGAFSTMLLADMGAEIIKVESRKQYQLATKGPRSPARGDNSAAMSTARDYANNDPGEDPWNRLSWFNAQARNKRDATMEIGTVRGRELFLRLVARSHGLIENNAQAFLEKLEIGPEVLFESNPGLVIVRMPPLGLWGPDASATGFGWHFEDLGAFLRVQGYPEGPEGGSIFMDGSSGPAGANAFLMGLRQQRRSGTGLVCEVSQVENMICHIGDLTMEASMTGHVPPRWGNRSPDFAPQGCYPCAGSDQWVVVSVRSDAECVRLLEVLAASDELDRPEMATLNGRHANHDAIDAAISSWTAQRTPMQATEALQAAGIPAGPVLDEAAAASNPQLHERGFFHLLTHPSAGSHLHPGANFTMSDTPPLIWRAAPTVGQDNEYVYKQIIGVTDIEYDALCSDGQIGTDYV